MERRRRKNAAGYLADPYVDRSATPQQKAEKWTYQLLTECKPLCSLIRSTTNELHKIIDKLHNHQFEWVVLVDNSGSMMSKKNQVFEAITVFVEVLRKLECPFSIVRFGASQHLLKDFNTEWNNQLGEQILESFSFDEGTQPATALNRVVNQIWGHQKQVRVKKF
jgi:hypothetical protein